MEDRSKFKAGHPWRHKETSSQKPKAEEEQEKARAAHHLGLTLQLPLIEWSQEKQTSLSPGPARELHKTTHCI